MYESVTFNEGFVIYFMRGWLLALVLISVIPVVFIAGGSMRLATMSNRGHTTYAESGNLVKQNRGHSNCMPLV